MPDHDDAGPALHTPRLDGLVDDGTLPGFSVAVRTADGSTIVRTRGVTAPAGDRPVDPRPPTAWRPCRSRSLPSSPRILTAEGVLAMDDEVRRWVPELDGLRVLRRPDGPLDDTEALARPVTVHDLLTMTSGLGIRFEQTPLTSAMADAGVHPGPVGPAMDDATFLARLGSLPLAFQPGAGWAYHTSTDVLSVVLARSSGVPLDRLLAERLTGPLDTPSLAFATPAADRRADAWYVEDDAWARIEPGGPADPQMLTLSCGLWGTAEHTARVLGELVRPTLVPADAVALVRAPGLTPEQLGAARPIVPEGYSFGHQVSVATVDDPRGPRAGSAGWSGGTGTLGIADPAAGRTVVVLTNRGLEGPSGAGAFDAALADLWSDLREDTREAAH